MNDTSHSRSERENKTDQLEYMNQKNWNIHDVSLGSCTGVIGFMGWFGSKRTKSDHC
jgi:hypothetical protein